MTENPPEAELHRRFLDQMSGAELTELHRVFSLVDSCGELATQVDWGPVRPELRRPPLREPLAYRIRVHLTGVSPPVWRVLELRSDTTLDLLHEYLSAVFDWLGDRLHRFSLGGWPTEERSQLFWCLDDEQAPEELNASSVECSCVRLDETIQAPGEVLLYSYGLPRGVRASIRLEGAYPMDAMLEPVIVLDGVGAAREGGGVTEGPGGAPPEVTRAGSDIRRANLELRGPCAADQDFGPRCRRLRELIDTLTGNPVAAELRLREELMRSRPPRPLAPGELAEATSSFGWFLESAAAGRLTLTSAGNLAPGMVQQACELLPRHRRSTDRSERREANCPAVRRFREGLRGLGLVRISDRRLQLTERGEAARDPRALWAELVTALPRGEGFDRDATLLILLEASASPGREIGFTNVLEALNLLGWQVDGAPVSERHLWPLAVIEVLGNVCPGPAPIHGPRLYISSTAALLAHEALAGAS